ncbi:MAG: FAD-dependent oxidoreductase, partial [Gammaproteobacteria bacterium]|nr:FAD-dependent oxidoreductase [Gammaproteobacteria bacterium]
MTKSDLIVPDIGGFDDVEVFEVHVAKGDSIEKEDSIITLESDKATMDIPSPVAGTIAELNVKVGDKISEGSKLGVIESSDSETVVDEAPATEEKPAATAASSETVSDADKHCEVLVLGAGPGGYMAAFPAADLGQKVILVERYDSLGGVCLNVGCIPSKALLHTAQVINEAEHMSANGIDFGKPKIDLAGINGFKSRVVTKLTGGLKQLARQRKVEVVYGVGEFVNDRQIKVSKDEVDTILSFENCIIAAGSQATEIPVFPNDDDRLMDSTDALELKDVPRKLLIIGGGIIGLEMATVYD